MEINLIGVASALATFIGVWIGHVSVRRIERNTERLWLPIIVALFVGVSAEVASFLTSSPILSAIMGIFGITLLWDALEFFRQQNRIRHGHAPANPNNPRHARILASHSEATTLDWLDREPRDRPYTGDELNSIKAGVK
jgi:hypothetical protein